MMSLNVDMASTYTDLKLSHSPRVSQVEHVLLYDFPRDPIEYMRRVGRTARAGRKGVVTVLAWGSQVSRQHFLPSLFDKPSASW